jgi:hypothetical protein
MVIFAASSAEKHGFSAAQSLSVFVVFSFSK